MNEQEFAKKIAQTLNAGISRMDDAQLARLHAAREKALRAYVEPVPVLGLATVSGRMLDPAAWIRKPIFWVPILALAASIAVYQWNEAQDPLYDEVGELDAKLLTGELP
ncbi:MAG: DUF3619 family protein, partial [Betaproteobacteria bacterium]|nr:DUF3619 family protein [Betaproteobacteria bacterium]